MTERVAASKSNNPIDRRSFILGMMTAFAECIANECKKVALSPPFYPEDYGVLLPEAENIAREQGIYLWYDKNLDIPETIRLNWFVLYKFSEVLDEYKRFRNQGNNPAWNLEKFSDLLSYGTAWGAGADKVVPKIREDRYKIETFARVLLKSGDWPIQKA
ncbi:MAG: hypothetical protein PVF26_11890 [Desulfobacterales bacterium]|jgi:hypothetical protein